MKFDYNELMLKGFYITKYDKIDDIPADDVILDKHNDHTLWPSQLPNHYKTAINIFTDEVCNALHETFSSVIPIKYDENSPYNIWDGVDSDSLDWHNDAAEGGNIFMLLYIDDVPTEYGGLLSVKMNDTVIKEYYPQRGDVVFISNELNVTHRAERATIKRRVCNLTFECEF